MGESVAGNNATSPTSPPQEDVETSTKSNGFASLNAGEPAAEEEVEVADHAHPGHEAMV